MRKLKKHRKNKETIRKIKKVLEKHNENPRTLRKNIEKIIYKT